MSPSWANAIAQNLSAKRFPVEPLVEEQFVESFDGTQLRVRIYRPDADEAWRAPIILHMSPYFSLEGFATDGLDAWLFEHFVPRGYGVALADVRGTGQSGGCLEHTGRNEAQDGYEIVEFLAARPWSNQRVGMIGLSYDAETQQATLTTSPPHLTTIVPVESIAGLYDHVYFDGVPYTDAGIVGAGSYTAQGMIPPRPNEELFSPAVYAERPGCHPENVQERSDPRGDFTQYWKDRELRSWIPSLHNTSVFFVHGLEDWNVKPIHIAGWYNELPLSKQAWIGQWQHEFPDANAVRPDWHFAVHRWFDHWLLGIDTGVMKEPPVQVQDSDARWRFEDAWPPQGLPWMDWYATKAGSLDAVSPGQAAQQTYTDNGLNMEDGRGESLEWTSPPLESPLHYSGQPRFRFTATISALTPVPMSSGTHFAVHLIDLGPDGTERIINRGYLDAQHRNTMNFSEPVPQGQPIDYVVRLFPQDDVLPAGHALRLRLGAVDEWIQPDGTNARVIVTVGGEQGTRLQLPIVDDATARFFTPPPVPANG